MTVAEFKTALRAAKHVFIASPCTGTAINVARGSADDVQHFQVSKSEARRVLCAQDGDIIAALYGEDLYVG